MIQHYRNKRTLLAAHNQEGMSPLQMSCKYLCTNLWFKHLCRGLHTSPASQLS